MQILTSARKRTLDFGHWTLDFSLPKILHEEIYDRSVVTFTFFTRG
jgi:hypothetical protein